MLRNKKEREADTYTQHIINYFYFHFVAFLSSVVVLKIISAAVSYQIGVIVSFTKNQIQRLCRMVSKTQLEGITFCEARNSSLLPFRAANVGHRGLLTYGQEIEEVYSCSSSYGTTPLLGVKDRLPVAAQRSVAFGISDQ